MGHMERKRTKKDQRHSIKRSVTQNYNLDLNDGSLQSRSRGPEVR